MHALRTVLPCLACPVIDGHESDGAILQKEQHQQQQYYDETEQVL
jgi:hypothetical protein